MVSSDQSGLRASAEGGGALRRDGVKRGSRAWKKIEGGEGVGSDCLSSGGRRVDRQVERGKKLGPGQRREL
jgi:hypothetical protein